MPVIAWCRPMQPRPAFAIAITSRFRTCMENPKLHQSGRSPVFRRPTSKTLSSILSMSVSSLNRRIRTPALHGLDQEFNSVDVQYDAASAYIKSQAHAGWALIRSRYDDGGYSGVPSQIQSRGTEFLDAETGGQKSTRETVMVGRDPER